MTSTPDGTKVVTEKVRFSYAYLFEPQSGMDGGEPKYSVTLLVPKDDKVTLNKMKAALKLAAENGKSTKFGGKIPSNLKQPIRDGDTDDAADGKEGYPGHYFVRCASKTAPGIVDSTGQKILDSSEVYSGCYGRASLNAYAYNTNGNKGVTFGLNNVMKLEDGESLGGRARAEDDFAAFLAEADAEAASGSDGDSDDGFALDIM